MAILKIGFSVTRPIRVNSKFWAFLALLFFGCSSAPIYSSIENEKLAKEAIPCLQISSLNDIARYILLKHPFFKKLQKRDCPWRVEIDAHFISSCTSAKARALGSDFDGFLRLSLFKGEVRFYRAQIDFKGCLNQKVINHLLKQMQKELHFQK